MIRAIWSGGRVVFAIRSADRLLATSSMLRRCDGCVDDDDDDDASSWRCDVLVEDVSKSLTSSRLSFSDAGEFRCSVVPA
jgi:hypothetical protein